MTAACTLVGSTPTRAGAEPVRVAIQFSIDGDLRFVSHRDELRLLTRALARARWPVAYSQGFNPQPRVVLPLPRSVGTASTCEWAVVVLNESRATERLQRSLAAALPSGCCLQRVVTLATRATPHAQRARYTVELDPADTRGIQPRIEELLRAVTLDIERGYGAKKPSRAINIRPYIETVTLDGRTLSMQLTFTGQRTARPIELLTALSLPSTEYGHRIRRVQVEWDIELAGPTGRSPSAERNNVGQEESCNAPPQERET